MAKINLNNLSESPCLGICSTSLGDDVCIGCGRTFTEVRDWNTYSDLQKITINKRLLAQNNKNTEAEGRH